MTPRFSGRGLSTAITILSAGYRPLGSCSRAAGWSAATLCVGTFRTCWGNLTMSALEGRTDLPFKRGHFRFWTQSGLSVLASAPVIEGVVVGQREISIPMKHFREGKMDKRRQLTKGTQQPPMPPMRKDGEWRASKLVGINVYNQANEKIGDINDSRSIRQGCECHSWCRWLPWNGWALC